MKRILSFVLLLLVFTLTFTSCELFNQQQPQPEVEYDVNLGLNALKGTYQSWNTNNEIKGDMDLVGQVQYRGVFYTVTWATECESATLTKNENGTTKLSVTKGETVVDLVLVATVSDPNGNSVSHTFNLKIAAAMDVMSHTDYIAAKSGDSVEVAGIVTFINSSKGQIFLEDLEGNGGYYIYKVVGGTDTITNSGIQVGMTIKVSGTKDIYKGTHEVKDAVLTIVDSSIKNLTVFDITDKYIAAADAKDTAIVNYLGAVVTIKGVEIGGTYDEQYYHYFKLDGVESYIRLADSCGLPQEVLATLKAEHIAHKGWTANITGRVDIYDGAFYLVPVSANAIEYVSGCTHNYEAEVTAPNCTEAGYTTHTCSLCGVSYKDSTVDKLGHTDENKDHVCDLESCGATDVGFHGDGDDEDILCDYGCGVEVQPTAVTYYTISFTKDSTTYYWNGTVSSGKGATTTNVAEAAQIVIQETDGGVYAYYTDNNGTKQYITIGSESKSFGLSTTATVIQYDATEGYLYSSASNRYLAFYANSSDIRTYAPDCDEMIVTPV